jgi:hypothetical protein
MAEPGTPVTRTEGLGDRSESGREVYFPRLLPESSPAWRVEIDSRALAEAGEDLVVSAFRERDEVLLGYDTPLRLGESDLLFKLRAPGKRRSILTLEVIF